MTRAIERLRIPLLLLAFGLLFLVCGSQSSAAKSPLGPHGWAPGELPFQLSSKAVTAVLFVAYASGALAVLIGLMRPRLKHRWIVWVIVLAGLALLTAPMGSGDHTNYAAYGRIALQGGDPYTQSPHDWHGGLDPITASVQPPWQGTPSIYGPFATSLMAVSSWIGGDNLRQTVWIWQIIIVAAWLGMRFVLLRLAQGDRAQGRVDVLWTFNPVVFGVLVLGAHVDVLAGMFACAALLAARRDPFIAGLCVGACASTKVTYGVVALGLLWAWRGAVLRHPAWSGRPSAPPPTWQSRVRGLWAPLMAATGARNHVFRMILGALLIVVPCYVVAGPHVLRQLGAAGGSFSYATPAAPIWQGLRHIMPEWAVGTVVFVLAASAMIAIAALLLKVSKRLDLGRRIPDATTRQAVVTTWALSTAYVLCAPYSLPWYDTLTWALLPLLVELAWDSVLVLRHLFMALAYVPGRVLGLSPTVEDWTLGFRKNVVPWTGWLALIALVAISQSRPLRRYAGAGLRRAGLRRTGTSRAASR
ncbi:polyprenol phosphomannose-dependent alpha 1,6 mannosyltransferase MptB [Luteipulveratus mongoliensis]|nr:polyprenol phosphomannose-dependent alpha 1,6 mannosyltransferase MptB [Luteipulveratus mongoliensis]